jgi:predicted acyltransferase
LALDALRGAAIMGMAISGAVPFDDMHLPQWMYHAQYIITKVGYDLTVPGFTWVDLVFPAFIFCMGASIPLALTGRIARGVPTWKLIMGAVTRLFGLGFFAIFVHHITPWHFTGKEAINQHFMWFLMLVGFGVLFLLYTRLPEKVPPWMRWGAWLLGVVLAVVILVITNRWQFGVEPLGFWERVRRSLAFSNIILLVLSNLALWGALAWLLTRQNLALRLGVMALAWALREAYVVPGGWVQVSWDFVVRDIWHIGAWELWAGEDGAVGGLAAWLPDLPFDLTWLMRVEFIKYMLIIIPGTIAGEQLLEWMKSDRTGIPEAAAARRADLKAFVWLSAALFGLVVFLHIGLQARWLAATTLVSFAACAALWHWTRRWSSVDGRFLAGLVAWGCCWLVLGIVLEPYQGGIKKDNATYSYFFVTSGMSLFLLASLTVWIDLLGLRRAFHLLIANGQNPMIAYVGIRNIVGPVFSWPGIDDWVVRVLRPAESLGALRPWIRFVYALLKTLFLAVFTALCTRLKIFWRT